VKDPARTRGTTRDGIDDRLVAVFHDLVDTLRQDFRRNAFLEPRVTLAVWRLGQAAHGRLGLGFFLVRRIHGVLDFVWTRSMIGAELPRSVPAGPGMHLPHSGRGVILHPTTTIGARVTLYHQVTIGVRGHEPAGTIEDDVRIYAGAKVVGNVTLGAGCRVGANAVVLEDVPRGRTVVGVPARLV
jgi:serine O-acetyltransferase